MPPESYEEFIVRTSIDGQGSGCSEPTRDPREAGKLARHNRGWIADAGLGGEVSIEHRTVEVSDWATVELSRLEPRNGA